MAPRKFAFLILLVAVAHLKASTVRMEDLSQRYQDLLLLTPKDYQTVDIAARVFEERVLPRFARAVRDAGNFPYSHRGVLAYFVNNSYIPKDLSEEEKAASEANSRFLRLVVGTLPMLAFAYQTPGPTPESNPYYRNEEVMALYLNGLEYCYSRGLTEATWLPGSVGRLSARALDLGLVRPSGDFSTEILRLGGFIHSVFLMREPLARNGLLDKYRAVVRNLVVNNGKLYGAFYQIAREEVTLTRPGPHPNTRYHLNADGIRLFSDYFVPYFLMIEDAREREHMIAVISNVIATNIAIKPGVQGTIKPDGTGFHHKAAYVGAYSPFAFETMAQLLYVLRGTGLYQHQNVAAIKLAVETYRIMVQKYTVSSALRGRLIGGSGDGASVAVAKAMAFLGHPDGVNDADMRLRFAEFFDPAYFFADDRLGSTYSGRRGFALRGFGILRLLAELENLDSLGAETPAGLWIKPYAAAAFFRRDNWLVTAKGFSRYLWDYEGPLDQQLNSFGQNWSYGLLQVFNTGTPISEKGSGYDYSNGWDWYHLPGTTASHYPIRRRTETAVRNARKQNGIVPTGADRNYNSKTFVGGVSLGDHGLFVQELEALPFTTPTDLQARKSYFFVGEKILALGSHIRGGTAEDETHTTIFQTRLESGATPTSVNGEQFTGLEMSTRIPAGSTVAMTDSVGNSYFLASSTSELFVSRQLQQSMTPKFEPTQGAFAQAYLNHGIRPRGDGYQYVVIPADPDGSRLQALSSDPSNYYQVIEDGKFHLVRFPQHGITGYAFYEIVETPEDQLVRRVNLPATLMTQEDSSGVNLAASVPDIGWRLDRDFEHQEAPSHRLVLDLRGKWRLIETVVGARLRRTGAGTSLRFECIDGLSYRVRLAPYESQ